MSETMNKQQQQQYHRQQDKTARKAQEIETKRIADFTARWQERLSGLKPVLELIAVTRTKAGVKELDERLKWWVDAYPNHLQLDDIRECYRERRHEIYGKDNRDS